MVIIWDAGGAPFVLVLERLNEKSLYNETKNEQENEIQHQLELYQSHIAQEVEMLHELYNRRDQVMDTFTWFLDFDKQIKFHQAQMNINDQIRIIHNEMEDMQMLKKRLKPLHGIFSRDFAKDIFISLLQAVTRLHVVGGFCTCASKLMIALYVISTLYSFSRHWDSRCSQFC